MTRFLLDGLKWSWRKLLLLPGLILILIFAIFFARFTKNTRINRIKNKKPRMFWGPTPVINFSIWSKAMNSAGFYSKSIAIDPYSINEKTDWDYVISRKKGYDIDRMFYLLKTLFYFDVLFISFDGFLLGDTRLRFYEFQIYHFLGIKVVCLPYGGDQHIYNRIRSIEVQHAYQVNYPEASRNQPKFERRTNYWTSNADLLLPGHMGVNGIGRWDVFAMSMLHLDNMKWSASDVPIQESPIVVGHFPNHRGVKGTEFLVEAIEQLTKTGLNIELRLFENIKNAELIRILREDVHIVFEHMTGHGHGLAAVEAMSLGKVVINNSEDDSFYDPFRTYSYFSECPIVSANRENLADVIKTLANNKSLRERLGKAGIAYVEKYHSFRACEELFSKVIEKLADPNTELINFFHPIIGFYRDAPKIQVPLLKQRIMKEVSD
jgi:glycosyltransferase involved in cell wall biosynthesis